MPDTPPPAPPDPAPPGAFAILGEWLSEGGVFLWLILLCGLVALVVVVLRVLWMRRGQMMPEPLVQALEKLEGDLTAIRAIGTEVDKPGAASPLEKITRAALDGAADDIPDLEGAVEARARREVARMHWGLPVLEVVVTIAPLLGLLGTAAGLVEVFGGIAGNDRDMGRVALGVGRALSTTIAGLAVAVPCVIAHTMFGSTVERCAVEMEVMMHRLVSRLAKVKAMEG